MKTSCPRIIKNETVIKILSKIYDGAKKKLLQIEGEKGDAWILKEKYPSLGKYALLIRNTNSDKVIMLFLELLSLYYKEKEEVSFYYIQEEYIDKNLSFLYQFDLTNIKDLAVYYLKISHLSSILLDSNFSWVLKLHNEGFGLLKGGKSFLTFFKTSNLSRYIEEPIWI